MWHVLHLIARPIEVLLGVFCVLTAIVLYPDEEGKLQSKFEDFWVRLDDYQKVAISRHSAFLQLVAKLESRLLDCVFGHKLLSPRSLAASVCLSIASAGLVLDVYMLSHDNSNVLQAVYRFSLFATFILVPCFILAVLPSLLPRNTFQTILDSLTILAVVPVFLVIYGQNSPIFFALLLVSIASDFLFIGLTRRLLRFAADIKRTANIAFVILLNCVLAILLCILPFWVYETAQIKTITLLTNINLKLVPALEGMQILAASNAIDAFLAFLFALLASLLLLHWLLWPLLTRTLFKMADIGTKGRRAILTTVGFALLAAGITGKVPELLQKLIEKLGG
jgi:hypothetical protein